MLYVFSSLKTSLINKKVLLLVVLQLWGLSRLPVFASPPVISYLGINQGLSNNSVRCIYQDQQGFMWFGTYDGLNRYDGYDFKVFRNNFKNSSSLINNWINTVNEDSNGNIWVGTRQGVCFYRNLSDRFSALYYTSSQNKITKVTSIINIIEKDRQGNMLVGTADLGLLFYAKGDSIASTIPLGSGEVNNISYNVSAIKTALDKMVFVFVRDKGLYTYDYQLKKLRLVNSVITSANCFAVDANFLWVGTNNGIHRYNLSAHAYDKTYNEENKKLSYKDVVGLTLDANNKLWIATNGGGVNILNVKTDEVEYLIAGNNSSSLQSNSVYAILEDRQLRKWIGTLRGGINIIDAHKERFKTIVSEPASDNTLISNYIFSFYEAANGDLWVGTDGEGLSIWNRTLNKFTNHRHDPANASTISNNYITDIKGDYNGNIWVATYRGGVNLYNKETGTFSHFQFVDPKSLKPITKFLTYLLYEDNKRDLWAGTLFHGLFRLNRQKNIFELFDETLKDIFVLAQDKSGNLWAGNLSQLIMVDLQNHKHSIYDIGKPVRSIHEDRSGNFWIGTEGGGLVLFDRHQNKIVARYTTDEGLCSNSILNTLEDEQGNLWMSTFSGISKFNIKSRSFKNYYQSDGLQSNQFNYNAALKLSTGELVFGGIKGFTFFKPEDINTINSTPQIFLTNIKINNNPIEQESSYIAKATNNVINSIRVPYDQAVLSFEFAALDYSAPEKIQYAFYLKGWDRGWTYNGNTRNATYTHLSEGNYTLLVKSTNSEGLWTANELRLTIIVLPPWYRTWWAYLIYAIVTGCGIYYYLRYRAKQTRLQYEVKIATLNAETERAEKQMSIAELQKEKAEREKGEAELAKEKAEKQRGQAELEKEKAELEKERAEREWEQAEREKERILNQHEREINEKKISFFTNISHEFRTPLTLIINPVKDLIRKKQGGQVEQELNIVYRNARRMLSLVDQLLLFRKAESGLDKLRPSKLNLYNLANEVYLCFSQQAKTKRINYVFDCSNENLEIYADREKLEIILYNLLSNALKYTPTDGSIHFTIRELPVNIVLEVKDSGAGVPKNIGDKLFDKFYQAERTFTSSKAGFGIGLFLVRHFTEQHRGMITYKSREGEGAVFTLSMLKGKAHFDQDTIVAENEQGAVFLGDLKDEAAEVLEVQEKEPVKDVVTEKPAILIIDDDEQIRQYLVQLFKDKFIIYQSEDGDKGLKLAQKYLPDLIITDIHMQGINGIELCSNIKNSQTLNHIPVILLTGSTSEALKLQGVEGGADDFITKPFDSQLLIARVANLLKSRNKLQKYFYDEITLNKNSQKISPEYKEFLDKCISVVENHLEDENFSVKTLLGEMGMSHSNLFRKVKSVSGQPINVFIRFIRLRKAAEILINSNCNINETAFRVGMQDIKYFREQFNKLFGMNPSDYIKKYRKAFGKQYTVDKESINPE